MATPESAAWLCPPCARTKAASSAMASALTCRWPVRFHSLAGGRCAGVVDEVVIPAHRRSPAPAACACPGRVGAVPLLGGLLWRLPVPQRLVRRGGRRGQTWPDALPVQAGAAQPAGSHPGGGLDGCVSPAQREQGANAALGASGGRGSHGYPASLSPSRRMTWPIGRDGGLGDSLAGSGRSRSRRSATSALAVTE